MKDIGMFRAMLAEIHKARGKAKIAVDNRDKQALLTEISNMQILLIDMKDLAYRQEDV